MLSLRAHGRSSIWSFLEQHKYFRLNNYIHWKKIVLRDSFDNQEFNALLNVLMKGPLIEIVSSKHTGISF